MTRIKLAYDDNLGLASDFAQAVGCDLASYHDLGAMIEAFDANQVDAMFMPAGTLPYVKNYSIIAQSLFSAKKLTHLRTNFVSAKEINVADIPHLILGRVNQYCTTSFWAPQIYLMNVFPQGTTLEFKNTNSFPDMLHKTATEQVDCAMVWDIIMQLHPEDTKKVHEYFYLDTLPTPIIVTKQNQNLALADKIFQFKTTDKAAFFTGFQQPDMNAISKFVTTVNQTQKYFNVKIIGQ